MSKKTELQVAANAGTELQNTSVTDNTGIARLKSLVQINENDAEQVTAAFAAVSMMNMADMIQESGEYLKFIEGEGVVLMVRGITEMEDTINVPSTGMFDVVEGLTKDSNAFVNGDVVFVSTVKKILAKGIALPFFVTVWNKGTKGAKGREYANLEIMRIPTQAVAESVALVD